MVVAVWSGDRWQVDKFELPQDTSVNVVNVKETDALTGETFDPNDFTTEGTDLIFGDDNVNIIDAKGGNDIIFAGGGDDVIIGGDGDDLIFGQEGDDILRGDEADDIAAAYFDDDYFIDPSVDPGDVIDPDGGSGSDDEFDPSLIDDDNVDPLISFLHPPTAMMTYHLRVATLLRAVTVSMILPVVTVRMLWQLTSSATLISMETG